MKPDKTDKIVVGIETALKEQKIPCAVVDVKDAPQLTRYEIVPGYKMLSPNSRTPRQRVPIRAIASAIPNIMAQLRREKMSLYQNGSVYIIVPKEKRDLVTLRDVRTLPGSLVAKFGIDIDGNSLAGDIAAMPHLMISGSTGSGKSVFISSLVTSLIERYSERQLGFVMIDPKRVELQAYKRIKHLLLPVVTDIENEAGVAIDFVIAEMMSRYRKMEKAEVNLASQIGIPYLILLIDEFADMVMRDETLPAKIASIAQMGRAAGIHMIFATQRPDARVVDGIIKVNFPARVAFALPDGVNSRIAIGKLGAENLLMRGDGLYVSGGGDTIRFQGCFVSKDEIKAIVQANLREGPLPGLSPASSTQSHASSRPRRDYSQHHWTVQIALFVLRAIWFIIKNVAIGIAFALGIVIGIVAGVIMWVFGIDPQPKKRKRRK